MNLEIDKLLVFDISGKFAHFRKYYTNASSLSYGIPPRTVIAGLISGILGMGKDSYYKIFDLENTRIGVSLNKKYRKIMQTLNYINTKDWKFGGNPQQVPMEILLPYEDELSYRIYFYNKAYIDELSEKIKSNKYIYNPYLGISEFLADINFIDLISNINIQKIENNKNTNVKSCFMKKYIKNIDFNNSGKMIIERIPVNFKENRELYLFDDYIYEENCNTINASFSNDVEIYNLKYKNGNNNISENIIFME